MDAAIWFSTSVMASCVWCVVLSYVVCAAGWIARWICTAGKAAISTCMVNHWVCTLVHRLCRLLAVGAVIRHRCINSRPTFGIASSRCVVEKRRRLSGAVPARNDGIHESPYSHCCTCRFYSQHIFNSIRNWTHGRRDLTMGYLLTLSMLAWWLVVLFGWSTTAAISSNVFVSAILKCLSSLLICVCDE